MPSRSLILVVDDDDAARQSLRALLELSGYRVNAYASAEACLDDAPSSGKCLISDVRMPAMDGLQLQSELTQRGITIPVILITGHGDVALAVNGMKAGALDFIEKPFEAAVLLNSVERALAFGMHAESASEAESSALEKLALLTRRERDVFDKIVAGLSNKVAAYELGISSRTIEIHRGHIMKKMNARSLADLTRISCAAPKSVTGTSELNGTGDLIVSTESARRMH